MWARHASGAAGSAAAGFGRPLHAEELQLHHAADLEFDGPLGRHLNPLKRLRVLGDTGRSHPTLEHAEIPELQTIAAAKLVHNVVKETLDDLLDQDTLRAGSICDAIDEFLLRDGSHNDTPTAWPRFRSETPNRQASNPGPRSCRPVDPVDGPNRSAPSFEARQTNVTYPTTTSSCPARAIAASKNRAIDHNSLP